jgi:hypothetical protein
MNYFAVVEARIGAIIAKRADLYDVPGVVPKIVSLHAEDINTC